MRCYTRCASGSLCSDLKVSVIDSQLRLNMRELTAQQAANLIAAATFYPEDGVRVQAYRYEAGEGVLRLPRGMLSALPREGVTLKDKRSFPVRAKHEVNLELDTGDFQGQREAVEAIKYHQQGIVRRPPGTGKSLIQLAAIAEIGTRALVIVHTEELLEQWLKYCRQVVPSMKVGIIQGKQLRIGDITIAMIQTLSERYFEEAFWRQFGYTVIDECHHLAPGSTYEYVINQTTSRYRIGTSASAQRSDKMHPFHEMVYGPVLHELGVSLKFPVTVEKLKTDYRSRYRASGNPGQNRSRYNKMIKDIVNDEPRNRLIAQRTDKAIQDGRLVLVLSRRIEHLTNIKSLMEEDATVLTGKGMSKIDRREVVKQFKAGEIRCILATQLADEGLDIPALNTVVLPYPSRFADKLFQQVGRALRTNADKTDALIIDVVDRKQKTLNRQWSDRRKAYREWKFKIKKSKRQPRGFIAGKVKRTKAKVAFGRQVR
jgi:superfamily II DNA or RNA helicase